MNDDAIAPPPIIDPAPRPVAPWLHTAAILFVLALIALYGHTRGTAPVSPEAARPERYTASMLSEWLLLGSVIAGIYVRRDFFLRAFRNRAFSNATAFGMGVIVYIAGMAAMVMVGGALYFTPLFHKRNEAVILAMMPHTPFDFVLWFGVSLTAGVCEEIIFRGYMVQQVAAWTRSPVLAVVLTSLVFGSLHVYEGLGAVLPLAGLAIVYAVAVRLMKGDLRAVIVAHTLQDFLVAVLALARPFLEHYQPKH